MYKYETYSTFVQYFSNLVHAIKHLYFFIKTKNKPMKTVFLSMLTAAMFCTTTYAQTERDYIELVREVLTMEKKVAVTEIMQFTDAESGPFWELYNEYNLELYKAHNKRVAVILDFAIWKIPPEFLQGTLGINFL